MRITPLGIMPKFIWEGQFEKGVVPPKEKIFDRCIELSKVITRYSEQKFPINIEWIKEYNKLVKFLFEEAEK